MALLLAPPWIRSEKPAIKRPDAVTTSPIHEYFCGRRAIKPDACRDPMNAEIIAKADTRRPKGP